MGKAQSKRSVDITTETKKGPEGGEEVTGKLEKIEDIDQKQVNGDATPQEKSDAAGGGEKKDAPDETENDKDLTTEKSATEAAAAAATPSPTTNANEGSGDQTTNEASPKEDAAVAATPVKEGEEISPLADEGSNKKTKKEKLKKKWSFRNLSFGKKDKSKPKAESTETAPAAATAENAVAATNGEAAAETSQPAAEGAAAVADAPKTDEAAGAAAAETKPAEAEKIENGVATEAEQKQMNGQKTPTSTDEAAEQKKSVETNETAATSPAPPAEAVPVAAAAAAVAAVSNDTANEKAETIVSNGTADAEKNGVAHDAVEDAEVKATAAAEESNSNSIPVDEKPHQNGTNGDGAIEELNAATKTLQIEVKTVHPNDSNNSTITSTTTTTTITTNSYTTNLTTTTTNTNTTTTIIPADNIITEQKTIDDDHNKKQISTDHTTTTNTTTDTTNTTSELPTNSDNKSLENCEEQTQPCKVILNVSNEESPTVVEVEDELINITSKHDNETEELQQPEQQQPQAITPPPLPVTAPPSQVAIFALKDEDDGEETTTAANANIVEAKVLPTTESEAMEEAETEPPHTIEIIETLLETTETTTAPNGEEENLITIAKSIGVKLDDEAPIPVSCEVIEMGIAGTMTVEELGMIAEQFATNAEEDLEAQALNIVDQIEKELEKQEQYSDEEQPQVEVETAMEEQELPPPQPIDMDICTQSNQDNSIVSTEIEGAAEDMLPPPPPLADEEKVVIETLNDCIGKSNEISIDSKHHNNHHHNGNSNGNGEGDQLNALATLTTESNIENSDDDLIKKIDELSLIAEHQHEEIEQLCDHNGLNNMKHNVKESITAAGEEIIEHDVEKNCIVGDFDDKEMPTAKELKENAAAAEIKTQDLPVTCE